MRAYLGFDIGATHTRAVVVRGKRIVLLERLATPRRRLALARLLGSIIAQSTVQFRVLGVGIAVAGVVGGYKLLRCPNAPQLRGFDFRTSVPPSIALAVDNDARAFLGGVLPPRARGCVLGLTIGTGIGRAVARGGKVLRVKAFEYPEAWERQYQARRFQPSATLARYVARQAQPIIVRYKPRTIALGGGVVERKPGFAQALRRELKALGVRQVCTVRGRYVAALGAARLVAR